MRRRLPGAAALAAVLLLGGALLAAPASAQQEVPYLAAAVASGKLPPEAQRLPQDPLVVPTTDGRTLGTYGGTWNMLVSRVKDTRLLDVFGYARLVAYDEHFNLVPDILKSYDVKDGRIFTFHLRKGMRWSDGAPFTTEDFRYWWQDVANNPELSPAGPPSVMLVDGKPPKFEVLNDTTVRYTWDAPNPDFLPALARADPLFIYMPAHYLKQFNARYTDAKILDKKARKAGLHNWAALHNSLDKLYKFDNPELPTLQPWMITNAPPAERFIAVRNPYYFKVDAKGRQLPYIDRVVLNVVASKLIPLKTWAGESDLQARGLSFSDYTYLKEGESHNNYTVRLWHTGRGSDLALYPDLNVSDPVWRKLLRDVRFRRALSLAIDRHEINQVIYYGLGIEGNNTMLPSSPLYKPIYRKEWAQFDLKEANRLLDEIGLTKRNGRGIRLLPDGRPLQIVVESAGEGSEESDILQLIHDSWLKAGIRLFTKPMQREVLRNRVFSGETVMSIWFGLENGIASADMSPAELAPTSQQLLQWPQWGQYYETKGASGEPIDMAGPKKLMELYDAWRRATTHEQRRQIWGQMLQLYAQGQYSIGLVAGTLQPVVVSNRMHNVPVDGMFNWDPGSQFGMYDPDAFYFTGGSNGRTQ